jgi:hypothetical protein
MRTSRYLSEQKTVLKEEISVALSKKIEFEKTARQFWPPQEVNVRWEFPDCVYRTGHGYSTYHLFSVDSDYKITSLKTSEPGATEVIVIDRGFLRICAGKSANIHEHLLFIILCAKIMFLNRRRLIDRTKNQMIIICM